MLDATRGRNHGEPRQQSLPEGATHPGSNCSPCCLDSVSCRSLFCPVGTVASSTPQGDRKEEGIWKIFGQGVGRGYSY